MAGPFGIFWKALGAYQIFNHLPGEYVAEALANTDGDQELGGAVHRSSHAINALRLHYVVVAWANSKHTRFNPMQR